MTGRIFWSIIGVVLVAVILTGGFIMIALYNTFDALMAEELKTTAGFMAQALSDEENYAHLFAGLNFKNRITLVAADGTVLYDNTANAARMANHGDRPEIISALENGTGESRRYSDTQLEKTIYYAVKLDNGNVLRISSTQRSVRGLAEAMAGPLVVIILVVALLSLLIARQMSRRIVAPINAIDPGAPLENEAYDELAPLLLRMERQNRKIREQMAVLSEKQTEFAAVTENMREGLVVLDTRGAILTMNNSAAGIFGRDAAGCAGRHILSVDRSLALQSAVEKALQGRNEESLLERHGRSYQLLASPVFAGNEMKGVVLLVLDVTDKLNAERSRREFTANVSHELKTPLTSISGYAEIMRNGVAQFEDMRDFASRIYGETNRLIALVDDIIRLSQLDEKVNLLEKEKVDLYALAEEVCARLQPLAEKKQVTLSIRGGHAVIPGIRNLLGEMLFNLGDNAVKYNVKGGSVEIDIVNEDCGTVLTVSDTGIGIPKELQAHVFERFYRVDKSHSRETGGTGLGLSIVKHVAAVHGASVKLDSSLGEGSKISIRFPG